MRLLPLALVALIGAACKGKAAHPTGFAADTVNGVIQVRNGPAAPDWSLEPVLALPADSAGLQRVASVLIGPENELYVADEGAAHIVVFDSVGREVRTIGRDGRGPGEFVDLSSIAWLGDSLVTYDPRAGRIQILDRRGGWQGEWPAAHYSGPRIRVQTSGRRFYAPAYRASVGHIENLLVGYGAGGPGDTLVLPDRKRDPPSSIECPYGSPEAGIALLDIPFAPSRISAATPDGRLVTALGSEYRLTELTGAGDTVRAIAVSSIPVPIADREWEDSLAPIRRFHEKYPQVRCQPADVQRPDAKPAVHEIVFDDRGRMWVEIQGDSGLVFDVFDSTGRRLGHMRAVPRDPSVPPAIRGDRLALVAMDSNGVQRVEAFRVVGRGE